MAQEMAKSQVVEKYGPYGSQLEDNWCMVLAQNERIIELIVRHGSVVDEIGFEIARKWGGTYTKRFGNTTSGRVSKIVLKCGEYVTKISGSYGNFKGGGNRVHVSTLKIHTNLCPSGYGPYGLNRDVDNKCDFSSPLPTNGEAVIGFFGRVDLYLESLGMIVMKDSSCYKPCE